MYTPISGSGAYKGSLIFFVHWNVSIRESSTRFRSPDVIYAVHSVNLDSTLKQVCKPIFRSKNQAAHEHSALIVPSFFQITFNCWGDSPNHAADVGYIQVLPCKQGEAARYSRRDDWLASLQQTATHVTNIMSSSNTYIVWSKSQV